MPKGTVGTPQITVEAHPAVLRGPLLAGTPARMELREEGLAVHALELVGLGLVVRSGEVQAHLPAQVDGDAVPDHLARSPHPCALPHTRAGGCAAARNGGGGGERRVRAGGGAATAARDRGGDRGGLRGGTRAPGHGGCVPAAPQPPAPRPPAARPCSLLQGPPAEELPRLPGGGGAGAEGRRRSPPPGPRPPRHVSIARRASRRSRPPAPRARRPRAGGRGKGRGRWGWWSQGGLGATSLPLSLAAQYHRRPRPRPRPAAPLRGRGPKRPEGSAGPRPLEGGRAREAARRAVWAGGDGPARPPPPHGGSASPTRPALHRRRRRVPGPRGEAPGARAGRLAGGGVGSSTSQPGAFLRGPQRTSGGARGV